MADLLISGVELPERDEILCLFSDGSLGLLDADYGFYPVRPIDCAKAVSLPEGHGKLIDIKDVKSAKFHIEGQAEMYSAYNIGWNDALDAVCMNAPSIVPAEGGGEG